MTTMTFAGWVRLPGKLWERVVEADGEGDAWRLLHRHADQLDARAIDLYVGPAGAHPCGRRLPSSQGELFR